MNAIFTIVLILSTTLMLFTSPEGVLKGMLTGAENALDLTLKLIVIYAVWLGVSNLWESAGLNKKTAKIFKPINNFLFGKTPEKAGEYISLNLSANFLGMSGATTPMGIKAIQELEKHPKTEHAVAMFFVINATSVQLIPSSVLALRSAMNSASPSDIILPTILATLLSSVIGILLVKVFIKREK